MLFVLVVVFVFNPQNLILKFDQRVNNSWFIVVVVDPRNLPLQFCQNIVSHSWDNVVVVVVAVVVNGNVPNAAVAVVDPRNPFKVWSKLGQ